MTAWRRSAVLGAIAVALVVVVGPVLGSPAAQASPVGDCGPSTGTVVAVDYSHWDGPIVRGCDLDRPASGIALLNDTGFRTTGTQHDGPQFLCRIGNQAWDHGTQYPTPRDEACVRTPPASAYWSYWLAPKGRNSWSYSQFGAYADKPTEGEVQLWIFGGTDITGADGDPVNGFPVCTPNSLRAGGSASTCTPTGTEAGRGVGHGGSRRTAASRTAAVGRGHGGAADGHRTSSAARRAEPTATQAGRSTARASTAPLAPTAGRSAATHGTATTAAGRAVASSAAGSSLGARAAGNVVDARPASTTRPPAGSAVPLVVGIGLAAVLAVGAGWAVRRRRRLDTDQG
ncbi:hypothetical protein SAMN05443575_1997 [Jatrophihabitans endophyticus]|uniref:LPXTG-motif cell wall anchor domain-containing protein n=1 Tax=Jatrophihabitans endophyticus TaxID=1206085 RepID=A0A1M5ITF9_9ACTN|nr:hypothetical protein [Jatrophihabitans endophyticus]SHG31536.1 hypothetical protein SAMN05443575_1997 [Jatrophihabitans endophyticus]